MTEESKTRQGKYDIYVSEQSEYAETVGKRLPFHLTYANKIKAEEAEESGGLGAGFLQYAIQHKCTGELKNFWSAIQDAEVHLQDAHISAEEKGVYEMAIEFWEKEIENIFAEYKKQSGTEHRPGELEAGMQKIMERRNL